MHTFLELAEDAALEFWMDAGTLLALVREGRLFENDKDIDVGLWAHESDRLAPVLDSLRERGHRVARETWRDEPFKFKVHPDKGEAGRVLDIQVYRESGGHAWSPVHTVGNHRYTWYNLPLLLRGAVRWPWRMWLAHHARDVEVTRFPWSRIGWVGTWWIPASYFQTTTRNNPEGLPFPHRKEEYLSFRYGDWKEPRGGWAYWRDDGAYRNQPPDRLIG